MNTNTAQLRRRIGRTLAGLLVLLVAAAPTWADTSDDVPDGRGVEAMFSIATWAGEQAADESAEGTPKPAPGPAPDADRRAMRQVQFAEQWISADRAVAACAERIADGDVDEQIVACLDALSALADTPQRRHEVDQMKAFAMVCRGQFRRAGEAMAALAPTAAEAQRPRLEAAAEILDEHPDGVYVITEEHLIGAALLGDTDAAIPPGPASLADPLVFRIALRDKAGNAIYDGIRMLTKAQRTRDTNAAAAEALCVSARGNFEWADAVTPGIAKTFRLEAARLQIGMIRARVEAGAILFDAELKAIGRQDLTVADYVVRLRRMTACLQIVQQDLDTIIALADAYPDDLNVAIRWARADRERITRMQATLAQELTEAR